MEKQSCNSRDECVLFFASHHLLQQPPYYCPPKQTPAIPTTTWAPVHLAAQLRARFSRLTPRGLCHGPVQARGTGQGYVPWE